MTLGQGKVDSPGGMTSSVPYATGFDLFTTLFSRPSYTNLFRWSINTGGKVSMYTCFVASTLLPLAADHTPGTVSGSEICRNASEMVNTSGDWISSWRGWYGSSVTLSF